jgi:hypothetical protein
MGDVWAVGEAQVKAQNGSDEEGEAEEYLAGMLVPSDFEQDEEIFNVEDTGLTDDIFWPPSPTDEPDDDDEAGAAMFRSGEENLPTDEPDDEDEAGAAMFRSGEENLPAASCPTAEATAVSVSPEKLQVAPAPEPSRPTGPPLKSAGGTVNKKRRAPNGVLAVARPGDGKSRPFRCSYEGCGYAAAKRRYLLEHERVHSGERPYKCTWPGCSYAASGQGHISRHKRTHTGDRPYPCKYPGCTYQASQSGHLRTHMRTHTGERPFRCPIGGCNYAAGRKGHLDRHMRVHTHPRLGTRAKSDGDTGTSAL